MYHDIFEVIIVEDCLVERVAPHTIITGVLRLCATDSVSARERSSHTPSMSLSNTDVIDVFYEYLFEVITSFFRVWH